MPSLLRALDSRTRGKPEYLHELLVEVASFKWVKRCEDFYQGIIKSEKVGW